MKQQFITEYERLLCSTYMWTHDKAKLQRYMKSVTDTLNRVSSSWHHEGECVTQAWKLVGGKGKPSLKALRDMED